jgi:LytR_cpsA_psr family
MTGRGRHGRAPKRSQRESRSLTANESGLRELGDQIDRPDGPPDGPSSGATANGGPAGHGGRGDGTETVANAAGLSALGEEMDRAESARTGRRRSGRRARSSRQRRIRRGALIGMAVLLVVVGGGAGYTYYLTHDLNRINVNGLDEALSTGQEAGTENILMVGSTSRCALTVQNPAYGLCSQGVNGVNSDVIMILHVNPSAHRLALLSIPRDLFIPNARSSGPNKVDAGLFQGLTQLVSAIQEDFGIPIQHTVSLNFDQFANVVNALGDLRPPQRHSSPRGGPGPPPAVQIEHHDVDKRHVLAPGEPQ